MTKEIEQKLQQIAMQAAQKAYVPYSRFQVGSALLCDNGQNEGQIISGCNVENLSYGLSNCGERTAIYKAISEGLQNFKAIAIYSPQATHYLAPCGACRQVLSEFVKGDFPVYMGYGQGQFKKVKFEELMPNPFDEPLAS